MSYSIINDIIFKIVFAKNENKRILIALLNAILGYSTVYYMSKLFGDQLEAGGRYQDMATTTGILITDFQMFDYTPDLHNTFRLMNVKNGEILTDKLELHYKELIKYDKDKPYLGTDAIIPRAPGCKRNYLANR